jgi:chaperone BCS1
MSMNESNTTADGLLEAILEALPPPLDAQFSPLLKLMILVYNGAIGRLGLHPGLVLALLGIAWGFRTIWVPLYSSFHGLVQQYLKAKIQIRSTDDAFEYMMEWFASQANIANGRHLQGETPLESAREGYTSLTTSGSYLNFVEQQAREPLRYTPGPGTQILSFKGRNFQIYREREMSPSKDEEVLVISCYGRSPGPIKELLQHAKKQFFLKYQDRTIIKRPADQFMRRHNPWVTIASRPSRSMETVILDERRKKSVLSDMNEYLHPDTVRWYLDRGIPHRRGYLFYGPPGTGKTSLSFALAGVFGLAIYVIPLHDPSIADDDLLTLFSKLPRRCIVLLEDIDAAGLERGKIPTSTGNGEGDDRDPKQHESGRWARISLSGFLNAIDGVASQEGRVLIMTTNKPEALDKALDRPGRIDIRVAFDNATQEQARELFLRIYASYDKGGHEEVKSPDQADLGRMAEEFSLLIPDRKVSPAAVQGFLLTRKKEPRRALNDVEDWVRETLDG